MKTKNLILISVLALMLSGCFIKSLYPFYTSRDVCFDANIIGTWMDNDSAKWVINRQTNWLNPPDSSYHVVITDDQGYQCSYNVHLFKINNQQYLDFYPIGKIGATNRIEENIILTHSLAKIEHSGSHMKIQWFNETWLGRLLDENKIRIRHETMIEEGEKNYLLTASTEELQKFIIKYGNDSLAFKAIWEKDPTDRNKEVLSNNLTKISNEVN